MGVTERREREREELRDKIVEAARDIVSEEGLDALSMRSIAERIEYSPGTIYLHFKDKDDLLREVIAEGFERLSATATEELGKFPSDGDPAAHYAALGRAYARFALENTSFFRVMFELPTVPRFDCCPESGDPAGPMSEENVVASLQRAIDAGRFRRVDARRAAAIGWGLIHGLTGLYLSGHLRGTVETREDFESLLEEAMESLHFGWAPDAPGRSA